MSEKALKPEPKLIAVSDVQDSMRTCLKNVSDAVESGKVKALICIVVREDGSAFEFSDARLISGFETIGILENIKASRLRN